MVLIGSEIGVAFAHFNLAFASTQLNRIVLALIGLKFQNFLLFLLSYNSFAFEDISIAKKYRLRLERNSRNVFIFTQRKLKH